MRGSRGRRSRKQSQNLPLPAPFPAGVFLFQQLGLSSLPAQWGRPGLPATAPGPWRARVSPLRRGFPLSPLKPPLTAARLPSYRDSGTGFVHVPGPGCLPNFTPVSWAGGRGPIHCTPHAALGRPLAPAKAADIPSRRDTRLSRLTKPRRTSPSPAGSNRLCGALLFGRRRGCAWC